MNVFISWSGRDSKSIGNGLREFLPHVIPFVKTWMSEKDIPAGGLWKSELHRRLSEAEYAVVCATSENTTAPWLLYELGCLAMRVPAGQLVPLLQGIEPKDVPEPLGSFQSLPANRDGVWRLVQSINSATNNALQNDALRRSFDGHWLNLETEWAGHLIVAQESGVHVVSIHLLRLLDENDVAMVRRRLQRTIEAGHNRLVVDLEKVQYLSSAALGAFLLNWKTAETSGGKIVFANACSTIRQALSMNGLDRIFEFFDNTHDAIESLTRQAAH